jgi:hypothetical protein
MIFWRMSATVTSLLKDKSSLFYQACFCCILQFHLISLLNRNQFYCISVILSWEPFDNNLYSFCSAHKIRIMWGFFPICSLANFMGTFLMPRSSLELSIHGKKIHYTKCAKNTLFYTWYLSEHLGEHAWEKHIHKHNTKLLSHV